jgi:glucose-1-phosphate thymidylyltransferase
MTVDKNLSSELIGIVPSAGHATRIQPLPCSKELLPIGFQAIAHPVGGQTQRPKVVSHYLLENMSGAGARKAFIILHRGKWDIPAYYGPGSLIDLNLAYVVTDCPYGAPFSVKQAFPFVTDATVLFGFPDIFFEQSDAFSRLLERLDTKKADIVLGLFPASNPSKMDMVDFDDQGKIKAIEIKPSRTHLTYTWILAVWSPVFTEFMSSFLEQVELALQKEIQDGRLPANREYYVGNVIQAALGTGLKIEHVIFESGLYLDIGTPDDLSTAIKRLDINKDR